jgi:hypothetical protein
LEYLLMIFEQVSNLVEWGMRNYQRPFILVVALLVVGFVFFVSRSPRH